MFFLSLLFLHTSKMMIAHGFFSYLTLKAQCTRLLGGVTSSSRQLTPSKDADVWRGNAYEQKLERRREVWDRVGVRWSWGGGGGGGGIKGGGGGR